MGEYAKSYPSREEQHLAALTREKEGYEARVAGSTGDDKARYEARLKAVNAQLADAAKAAKSPANRSEERQVGVTSGSGTEQANIRRVVADPKAHEAAQESGLGPATEALAKETASVPGTAPEPADDGSGNVGANRVADKGETAERIPGTDTVVHSKDKKK